jgi:TatA/E family protein of Tat protein translocase
LSVFGIGPAELVFVFVLALIFIGPGKMPEVAASLGKALREFQKASAELTDALSAEVAAVQAAKEAASNGNQIADISDVAASVAPVPDTSETSACDSIRIGPVEPVREPGIAPSATATAAAAAAGRMSVSGSDTSPIFPPVADPAGLAPLPSALLDCSDSMRGLTVKHAAAPAAGASQMEA